MKIIVTGAGGMVGRALVRHCTHRGAQVAGLDHAALDISDAATVESTFRRERPEIVFNSAAFTDVDGCERNPEQARLANARGPELLAAACRQHNALLVTISTDYVFDGEKDGFYSEGDSPNPISMYGVTKLEGERAAQAQWKRTIVVRSGYLFGTDGTNFLATCIDRLRRGEKLRVINDMFGTPTYATHLAARLFELAERGLPGIYHVANSGDGASFAQFAHEAAERASLDHGLLTEVSVDSLNLPAPRPRNSRLRGLLSETIGLPPLPDWHEALAEFIEASLKQSSGAAN
jgi:dTDP-4-dehydrorhamnose reductase